MLQGATRKPPPWLLGGVVAQQFGFRVAFLLQGFLNLLGVLLVQLAMPSHSFCKRQPVAATGPGNGSGGATV